MRKALVNGAGPGMANRTIRTLADLTPTAYAAKLSE